MDKTPKLNVELALKSWTQIEELYVSPEIERRRAEGRWTHGTTIQKIQIVFDFGKEVEVRFNDEIKALLLIDPKPDLARTLEAGDALYESDIASIVDILLTEEDPNAGHVTVIKFGGSWTLAFDFRYNSARTADYIWAAEEFLAGARFALNEAYVRLAIENLFAAVELLGKAALIDTFGSVLTATSHTHVRSRLNLWARHGNIDPRFAALANRLAELRSTARYLNGDVPVTLADVEQFATTALEMAETVRRDAPRRTANILAAAEATNGR